MLRTALTQAVLLGLASAQLQSGIYTHYPDCVNGPALLTSNLVCDTNATPYQRASAIINAMNITEKLANLLDVSYGSARLGLPPYEWWSEALHGVAGSPGVNFTSSGNYSYATSFPMPITFSSAFDDPSVQNIASVISTEARAYSNAARGGLDYFTPNINPFKDPRWGRGSETPGEDPLRIQGYVKNLLIGLEGTDDGYFNTSHSGYKKMIATCKHFAGYDLEDWDGYIRYGYDAEITTQDLAEYYLPPFQTCARDQNVASIMCSYNSVNSVPACANSYLQETILREHWGWTIDNNYITSDCNAISDIYYNHNYSVNNAAAAGLSLSNGMDTACIVANTGVMTDVNGSYYGGYVTEATITTALIRQYEALVIAGYFDPASSNPYRSIGWSSVNTPAAQTLARQAATEGTTLLKNTGLLPYKFTSQTKVAMIGMWANGTSQMQGGYSGPAPYLHSPLYAASQLGLSYNYANGPINQTTLTSNYSQNATAAAQNADVILFFGGIDWSVEAEAMDRYQIAWPGAQQALIAQLAALGKPMIVLQMGSMLDATPILSNNNISALVWVGYPGQDGGVAAFDILTGAVAPAGRLPVTMYPADYVNQVPMTNMSLRPGPGNPGRTYKWYNNAVLPFAYGLHYTTFKATFNGGPPGPGSPWSPPWNAPWSAKVRRGWGWGNWGPPNWGWTQPSQVAPGNGGLSSSYNIQSLLSSCTAAHPDLCAFPSVAISVQNAGQTTSDFVALVFSNTTAGPAPYPYKSLASYTRLHSVAAGQTVTASLNMTLGVLARRDDQGNQILYPGTYNLLLDVPTQATMSFQLTGQAAVLDQWPQPPANQTYDATINCPLYGQCKSAGQPVA
ncbi:glycoside hydrolase family 3 protein [Baudoinia panamericana UAMH 10762]|uniref:xylan 1,4-beta-xylosidase n=1 Tax=Baudoinia panamericana (strain UAMH 10762) TaxID=717646 RepID=M2N8C7_BAUPA|nr:glycoside hydrolase family 3 protein [Baudoinia panamericana UAMH 10762]EMC95065.1 glycoside hydrolase family 3 protein [Baudoinia panamericana UAMH 10762]